MLDDIILRNRGIRLSAAYFGKFFAEKAVYGLEIFALNGFYRKLTKFKSLNGALQAFYRNVSYGFDVRLFSCSTNTIVCFSEDSKVYLNVCGFNKSDFELIEDNGSFSVCGSNVYESFDSDLGMINFLENELLPF